MGNARMGNASKKQKKINHIAATTKNILDRIQSTAKDARSVVISGNGVNETEMSTAIQCQIASLKKLLQALVNITQE